MEEVIWDTIGYELGDGQNHVDRGGHPAAIQSWISWDRQRFRPPRRNPWGILPE